MRAPGGRPAYDTKAVRGAVAAVVVVVAAVVIATTGESIAVRYLLALVALDVAFRLLRARD